VAHCVSGSRGDRSWCWRRTRPTDSATDEGMAAL